MKQCVLLLMCALGLHALSFAQAPKSRETGLTASVELSQEIDKIFAPLDGPTTPGAAIILVKDGAVFYERGYGSANLEYGIRVTPATVFDIASVSKQFTGLAIAMLIEQGKVALDADIRTYLPEMPDFGKTITVRHLIYLPCW
jgi:CubicO group peptidase (beta-lactamase class C family)